MQGVKSGFVSSEFLGVVVSMAVSSAVLLQLIPAEQAVHFQDQILQFTSLCIQLVTTVGAITLMIKPLVKYIEGRVALKIEALKKSQ